MVFAASLAMKTTTGVLSLLLLTSLTIGCAVEQETVPDCDVDPERLVDGANADVVAVVDGNADFAFELHRRLGEAGGNVFTSPFSISAALAMTYAGARGQTATEMHDVLHVPVADDQFHQVFGGLMMDLDQPSDSCFSYEMSIGNRLFGQAGYGFEPDFVDLTGSAYGAPIQELDFLGNTEGSRNAINRWVSDETRGYIPELFTSLDPSTVLVLTNAIYFKGTWVQGFDAADTTSRPFQTPGGEVQVEMMAQEADFRYATFEGGRLIELPYEGDQISLVAILPDEVGGLGALEADLDAQSLRGWRASMHEVEVDVRFPKLELRQKRSLVEDLIALGMPSAFGAADFTGISAVGDLAISEVVHEAYVAIDEEGTVAAAATGVEMGTTSDGEQEAPVFHADHPFLFLIMDDVTGSVLFLGRIEAPTGGGA